MLKKLLPAILTCAAFTAGAQTFPVKNIKINGPDTNRVNLVFLAEGYTAAEQTQFATDATGVGTKIFNESPLKEYRNFFNTYAIQVTSAESGTTHPGTATDVTEPASPITSANTFFQSTFDNNNTHRAIVCMNGNDVFNVAAANVPNFDILYVLVNTTEYGGTGGGFCTSTMHPTAAEIAVHEIGHTFGHLADEYWAGDIFANEKPNMTQETNTSLVKWKNWISTGGVGIYPYGTSGNSATWFRPHQNCKMQFLGVPFCGVCKETLIDEIYNVVTPVDDYAPRVSPKVLYNGNPLNFNVKINKPVPNTVNIKWKLNNTFLPATDTFVNITGAQLQKGDNDLIAYITDSTALSRSYRPTSGYQFTVSWKVYKDPTGVATIESNSGNKFFYHFYPVPAHDKLVFAYTNETGGNNLDYMITDVTGKTVKKGNLPVLPGKQETTFDISTLVPGTYVISFEGQQVSFSTQIVKE